MERASKRGCFGNVEHYGWYRTKALSLQEALLAARPLINNDSNECDEEEGNSYVGDTGHNTFDRLVSTKKRP